MRLESGPLSEAFMQWNYYNAWEWQELDWLWSGYGLKHTPCFTTRLRDRFPASAPAQLCLRATDTTQKQASIVRASCTAINTTTACCTAPVIVPCAPCSGSPASTHTARHGREAWSSGPEWVQPYTSMRLAWCKPFTNAVPLAWVPSAAGSRICTAHAGLQACLLAVLAHRHARIMHALNTIFNSRMV